MVLVLEMKFYCAPSVHSPYTIEAVRAAMQKCLEKINPEGCRRIKDIR
jgi:hypothetical protein